jgi:hypothetical protein
MPSERIHSLIPSPLFRLVVSQGLAARKLTEADFRVHLPNHVP